MYEIKSKQDEDKGKEGRISFVGDSNLLCHLLYMAFITTTNSGGQKHCLKQLHDQKGPLSTKADCTQLYIQKPLYAH